MKYIYRANPFGAPNIQRIPDWAWIPFTTDNGDYRRYLEWLDKGNTPLAGDVSDDDAIKAWENTPDDILV